MEFSDRSFVELLTATGSDKEFVRAARVSFNASEKDNTDECDDRDIKLIDYLIRNGHWSPFEMSFIKFKITTPIFVARQFMRHRTWSYNEMSLRYVEPLELFYVPKPFRFKSKSAKQGSGEDVNEDDPRAELIEATYKASLETAYEAYQRLIKLGIAPELARGVLPVSQYTTFIAATDFRNLLHFFALRLDHHAQKEIRDLAQQMLEALNKCSQLKHTLKAWENHYKNFIELSKQEQEFILRTGILNLDDDANETDDDDIRLRRILKEKILNKGE